ncbi:hypothetical protein HDU67_009806 [Dinochytrium kinnereticum]|nr:hypothetical protein HDU67_009806 [Dinochytrium kinnereticum]
MTKTVEQISGIWGSMMGPAASAASSSTSRSAAAASAGGPAKSSTSSLWAGVAAVAAVAAAGYAASQHPTVQNHMQRTTEAISKHVEFLGPLWKVGDQELRISRLRSLDGRLVFKCFYLQTPIGPPGTPPSTFISIPTNIDPASQALFCPIRVPKEAVAKIAADEIDAHMNMFDALMGSAYFDMMQQVTEILRGLERRRA